MVHHLQICLANYLDEVANGTSAGSCQHVGTWLSRPLWLWSKSAADVPSWGREITCNVILPERLCIVAPSWLIKEVLHCPEFGQVCSLWYRCCALRFVIHVRVVHLAKTKCFGFRGPDAHRHWTSTSRHCIRQSFKAGAKLWIFWLKLTYCFPSFPVMSHSQVANQCFAWFSERDATGWTRCGLLRAGSMAMLKFSCCLTNV